MRVLALAQIEESFQGWEIVHEIFFDIGVQREIGETIGRPTANVETGAGREESSNGNRCRGEFKVVLSQLFTCNMLEPMFRMNLR